ncbi:hypothetical protein FQN50_004345 [Emmonsiellopsis sp. PD_5]|nr:hypothetical protein FQN50_004345 [Emmonsiellopsis sp. PD_5]
MIIRQLCRRQGLALLRSSPRTATPTCGRFFSSESDSIPPIAQQHTAPPASRPDAVPTEVQNASPAAPPVVGDRPEDLQALVERRSGSGKKATTGPNPVARFNKLGSTVSPAYQPEDLIRNPPKPEDVTLELLLASQSHLGHATSLWNPGNSGYIFGIRQGVHIISLDTTAAHLRRAAKVVHEVARNGGLILFVGTRKGQSRIVVNAAEIAGGCHVFDRWIPGSLTNAQQILGHCARKPVNAFDEELPEYQHLLEGYPVLKPDLVVCLNPLENRPLLHECGLHTVPTIGIIDTDADPTHVTYPIPANDDSLRCVAMIAGVLGRAAEAGQAARLEAAEKGRLTYEKPTGFGTGAKGKALAEA